MAARSPVHQSAMDIQDPDVPSDHQMPVNPNQPGGQADPGLSTMANIFPKAEIVDEVQELPMQQGVQGSTQFWVVRPKENVEDMTLGVPIVHLSFKAGTRYKVPRNIAYELARLDYLIEQPFPYDEATYGRR